MNCKNTAPHPPHFTLVLVAISKLDDVMSLRRCQGVKAP